MISTTQGLSSGGVCFVVLFEGLAAGGTAAAAWGDLLSLFAVFLLQLSSNDTERCLK